MKNSSLSKFQNKYLQWFKGSSPFMSIATNLLIVFLFAAYSIRYASFSLDKVLLMFSLGYIIWTLMEYSLHRFVFHDFRHKGKEKKFHFLVHGVHHASPLNTIFLPMILRMAFVALFFGIFYVTFKNYSYSLFTGFFLGASIYSTLHWAIHQFKAPSFLEHLWIHHNLHHHKFPNKAFGTTTRFWDFIFRTMPK